MKLLVSINNKRSAERRRHPDVFLYRVDTETGAVEPVPTEHADLKPAKGMTGLCHHGDAIVGVRQHRPNQLVVIDPDALAVEQVLTLQESEAGHSVASHEGDLYLVATGRDAVVRVSPDEGEEFVWQHGAGERDTIHCNSVTVHDGRLAITGFGPKKGDQWASADEGFIRDVERDEVLGRGMHHPHSLVDVDGELHWCESWRGAVRNARGQELVVPDGYTRGLHVDAEHVVVGASAGRRHSASEGAPLDPAPPPSVLESDCQILVYGRDRDDLSRSRLLRNIDMSAYGAEIYALLPLD